MFTRMFLGKMLLGAMIAGTVATTSLPAQAGSFTPRARVEHQQTRIDRGVESGQLTRAEYQRDEARLHAINAQRRQELRANGGHLTSAERARLGRELNRNSGRIYFTKHNLAHQPGARTR